MSTKTLVVGATGDVGREVMRALRARGVAPRALVRSIPAAPMDHVIGDLAMRGSLDDALAGCESAVFITPHDPREEAFGHNFIDACEAAGIRRLVYISAYHPISRSSFVQRLFDALIGVIGPHYRAKLRVERRVRATALSPVVLCPSNFYQNDELGLPEILAGTYPQPLGRRPSNRVDTRDIGDAAARAIVDDVAPGAYPLVGPQAWTGVRCAMEWSEALGMPVEYAGDDIERWRASVGARMPRARAADFARTYRVIQRYGIPAGAKVIARTTAVLGREPRDYQAYVRERVQQISVRARAAR